MVNKTLVLPITAATKQFLQSLGLDTEETKIFLSLVHLGVTTVLTLSQRTRINRTTLYRRLTEMERKGLVVTRIEDRKTLVSPVEVEHLERMLAEQTSKVQTMQTLFAKVRNYLAGQAGHDHNDTKVLFYRGKQGIRQMVWHTLRAETEVVGYTYRDLAEFVGRTFMDNWRDAFLSQGLTVRDIYSDHYIESRKENPWNMKYPKQPFPSKYFPDQVLDIDYQMDIYNDVVAQYNWFEGEVFGVEIYNIKVARMQKAIFEILWKTAFAPPVEE